MFIKNLLRRVAEKLTGRKCAACKYNWACHCTHPDDSVFMRCWHSITRPGFTGKYEKTAYVEPQPVAGMSTEEQHQLQKIKESLDEAGEIARDSGLLED